MAWYGAIEIGAATAGVILVPRPAAMIQDLGAFRSGRCFETDLLPASALVSAEDTFNQAKDAGGEVSFAFEGNANGAVNLTRFHERCACAAGRLITGVPSIAYGRSAARDLVPVARYDLHRFVFTEILGAAQLEAWSGERLADMLPPPEVETPCADPGLLAPILKLPMNCVVAAPGKVMIWKLLDGHLLVLEGAGPIVLRDRDDPELWRITDLLELRVDQHRLIYGSAKRVAR